MKLTEKPNHYARQESAVGAKKKVADLAEIFATLAVEAYLMKLTEKPNRNARQESAVGAKKTRCGPSGNRSDPSG